MPNYRRNYTPGGTYFFTVNLLDRKTTLLTDHIDLLRAAIRATRATSPFTIHAWVVLPHHMHCIWTLPPTDTDYSARWRAIKRRFSKSLPPTEPRSPIRLARGERAIWQRRFWEHTIQTDTDYAHHVDYIHFNPVKHALAPCPAAWPYSTFHRAVAQGLYPASWSNPDLPDLTCGKRSTPALGA